MSIIAGVLIRPVGIAQKHSSIATMIRSIHQPLALPDVPLPWARSRAGMAYQERPCR